MEDLSMEWEIKDYSTCLEEAEPEKSDLGWIMETGLNLGKKFVITGVMVSTVTVVLPPLMVVSAIGFAFSLPFGFVFASYVCTEKLMSKLLPSTSQTIDYAKAWPNGENEMTYVTEKLSSGDQFTYNNEGRDYDELTVNESLEGKDEECLNNEELDKDELKGLSKDSKQSEKVEEPSSNVTARETVVVKDAMPMEETYVCGRNKEDKKNEELITVPVEQSSIQGGPGVDVENVDFAEDDVKKNVKGRNEIQRDKVEDKNTKVDKVVSGMKGTEDMKTNAKGKGGSDRKGKKKTSKILSGERREPREDKSHEKFSSKEKESHSQEEIKISGKNNLELGQVVDKKSGVGNEPSP